MSDVVNIHDAKSSLSKLISSVEGGETVILARAGKPVARLVPLDPPAAPTRLGFLRGELSVPDDFDEMGVGRIQRLFAGESDAPPA